MPINTSTYRQIAREAGVSLSTVSCALRNRPKVSVETRKRIRKIAANLGYVHNPVFASMMSQNRRRTSQARSTSHREIRAILGFFMTREEKNRWMNPRHSTHTEFVAGMEAACVEEGFACEKFLWDDFGESTRRLFACLRARKVPGVIHGAVPAWALSKSNWANYALATRGNPSEIMKTHYSSVDHYRNAWMAIARLVGIGYERIGFVMLRSSWAERSSYKALSAYAGWVSQLELGTYGENQMPPPFFVREWERDTFLSWIDRYRPDALLIAENEPVQFLNDAGWRIPEDIGVAHLDLDANWSHLAGIRQNNFEVGQAAAHLVIDQINRSAFGVPEHARGVLITGDWFAGPSVRQKPSGKTA